MAKKKYYVVWQGHKPGIYDNWPDAQAQVKGYPGARFKGFPTLAEAEAAFAEAVASAGTTAITAGIDIYCDGACDSNPGPAGTGLVVYRGGVLEELCYGLYNPRGTNNTAELNGLYQALLMAEAEGEPVRIHCDSDYSINAISTWGYSWKAKGWKTKSGLRANVDIIEPAHELYDRIRDRVQLLHVRGHTGVEGNELADRMAMLAIARQEPALAPYDGAYEVPAILRLRAG